MNESAPKKYEFLDVTPWSGNTAEVASPSEFNCYVPCQSCGVPCKVPDGFVGCAFCADCRNNDTHWTATTEDFMPRIIKY